MSDNTKFTFTMETQRKDSFGAFRDYVDRVWFDDLPTARRAHDRALAGHWIQPGEVEPHVSALRVKKAGRLLPEELAPKADWCGEHEKFGCRCAVKEAA
jgi:hypothetical protein